MENLTPADIPDFMDPLLDYMQNNLPSPLYSFLISFLSHGLALFTSLFSLLASLLSTDPRQWDAQTVLPPIIALLSAYLALLSLYRTTSWMFRTSIWFVKWGSILGALVAGVGWIMGASNNDVGRFAFTSGISALVMDLINGQGLNAAGGARSSRKRKTRSAKGKADKPPPKIWESFKQRQEWQYQENEAAGGTDIEGIVKEFMSSAAEAVTDKWWWSIAKSAVGFGNDEEPEEQAGRTKRAKTKGSKTR